MELPPRSDPAPRERIEENGQKLVLLDPRDKGLTEEQRRKLSVDVFKQLEDEILEESADVIHGALAFADIDPKLEEVPAEWVEQWGRARAEKRFRLAKAAWLNQSEAPSGLKLAQSTYIGISRVRAGDKLMVHQLNIGYVELVQAKQEYPELEVEERK